MNSSPPAWGRAETALTGITLALVSVLIWATVFDGWRIEPVRDFLRTVPMADKLGHLGLYGSITFFTALVLKQSVRIHTAASVIMFVGIADEFRQLGEFGRSYSFEDVVANGVGVLAGMTLAKVIIRRWGRQGRSNAENAAPAIR